MRARKHWGWGFADEQPSLDELGAAAAGIAEVFGFGSRDVEAPVPLEAATLPEPRIAPPPGGDTSAYARATHAWGKSYSDVVRGFRGRFDHAPDAVLYPADEREVEAALEWAAGEGVAVIPFGGGTSVVGGVTPMVDRPAVSLDLGRLDRVLEVDPVSRSARIQAGALGPALEAQLAEHGMTLRHFPQSFEFSTLGGWVATRAGGHFATVETHIDDLVESVRAVTPAGVWSSRRLPGSGAGPSPDRLLIGSEGTLGVITEAWVRVRPRPVHRRSAGVAFATFEGGAEAVRALSQSGLNPSNCRLIDPLEARYTGTGDGSSAMLVLGFESADHPVDAPMERALEIVREHGGDAEERDSGGAVGSWRTAFLRAPYFRDTFVACGVMSDTFETSITWERFGAFHEQVLAAAREAAGERAHVSCRFTHVYPNGPAPYYTVIAPARRGEEVEQWAAIKAAASDAVIAAGGTITHHHAVGRDHRPWYDRQRPDPFAAALAGAKAAVDPRGILNPGVLIDA
ncbi:MAG TPA: FAD-binding oxidoreductase [Solirubrobacteraceae bacterium]|nr:FAD-binding oxidoreductase [Solirubrobacteraceae bacterium]